MILYCAYGANLCKRAMRIRCSDARPIGKFMLTNAKLVFRGAADVEYCPGSEVPCGLWMISESDERSLDRCEGVRHNDPGAGVYYKETGIVLRYQGKPRNALIYLMNSEGIYPPTEFYVETIRKGYRDFGLDEAYLDNAIKESFLLKDPDDQTRSRRERQLSSSHQRRLVEMPEAVLRRRLDMKEQRREQQPLTVAPPPKTWTASTVVKSATPPPSKYKKGTPYKKGTFEEILANTVIGKANYH